MKTAKAILIKGTFVWPKEKGNNGIPTEIRNKWRYWWNNDAENFPRGTGWKKTEEWGYDDYRIASRYGVVNATHTEIYGILTADISKDNPLKDQLPEEDFRYDYTNNFFFTIEGLNDLCNTVAKYCGGQFVLETTKEFDIKAPETTYKYKDRSQYYHKCARKLECLDPNQPKRK